MPTGPGTSVTPMRDVSNLYTQPYVQPTTYPSVWGYTVNQSDPDAGRLKFALELIADGGLTKEAIEKVAKKALRRGEKKA